MRCPDCNKFVSYDEPQAEVQSAEVSGETITVSTTVTLCCADCGTELKSCEIEGEAEIKHECDTEGKPADGYEDGDEQYEIDDCPDAEGTSRMETKDRHGKPIKNARYMKTFYGFSADVECTCLKCSAVFPVTVENDEQASGFDECC